MMKHRAFDRSPLVESAIESIVKNVPERCKNCPYIKVGAELVRIAFDNADHIPDGSVDDELQRLQTDPNAMLDNLSTIVSDTASCEGSSRGQRPDTGSRFLDATIRAGTALLGERRCENPNVINPLTGFPIREEPDVYKSNTRVDGVLRPTTNNTT